MDIKIFNNEKEFKEKMNIKEIENKSKNDINNKKANASNEDDNIYIIDEIVSYCSSPTSGLVSIKKTKNNNKLSINIGSDISNITNTITLNISMIKTEINNKENNKGIIRSISNIKNENKEKQDNDINNNLKYRKSCSNKDHIQTDKDKKDKFKSFFKKKTKRIKDMKKKVSNDKIIQKRSSGLKKKTSKTKNKKIRKNQEKYEEKKNHELSKSSSNIDKDKDKEKEKDKEHNIKKYKKKTHKERGEKDYDQIINDNEMENVVNKKEIDGGKSPKIIILDFSSSGNN